MTVVKPQCSFGEGSPKKVEPDPVADLALAVGVAAIVLWMSSATHAVEAFLAVLALLHGRHGLSKR